MSALKVNIRALTGMELVRELCDSTRKAGMVPSKMTLERIYQCEHSPVRGIMFKIDLWHLPSFVSTHFVRHKFGVEHYVESNRDDRGGAGDDVVTRNTPVHHGMLLNAQAVINMSLKRLCYAASGKTVGAWRKVRNAMGEVDPALRDAMVPECVRRGYCPELRQCRPGLKRVLDAYADSQPARLRREQMAAIEGTKGAAA